MITTKELGYVSSWATKVPYPGIEYSEQAVEKLVDAFNNFNKYYSNKEYDIILSNGEQILFEILEKNLCHMLGIDYKNIMGDFFTRYREDVLKIDNTTTSYELLKTIIENIDNVLKYDYDHCGFALNYYRIMIKCSIFEKLSDFSRFNFGVINFDKDKYNEKSGTIFSGRSQKFLYVQSNEAVAPYFMMGILSPEQTQYLPESKYIVETLIAPTNVDNFFNEQEVVIPTQILITTEEKMDKIEAKPNEKIALLNQYKSIINQYKLPNRLNIYGDYESMLVHQEQTYKRKK